MQCRGGAPRGLPLGTEIRMTYKLMIRCPVTGKIFDSGIRTSGRETLNSGLMLEGKASCGYCRQIHPFNGNSSLDVEEGANETRLWRPNR